MRAIDPQVSKYAPYPNDGKPAEARKYVEPTQELLLYNCDRADERLRWRTVNIAKD